MESEHKATGEKIKCKGCGKWVDYHEHEVDGYCPWCVDGMRGLLDD